MGEIIVETPQGEVIVEIAGSEPTPEEQQKIRAAFSAPTQVGSSSFDDLIAQAKAKNVDEGFDYETGADAALRAKMSFGDIEEEREAILLKEVGPEGYVRDSKGRLALTPEGQRIRGMSPSDKNVVIEDEGFTLGDLADLAGILPETIGAITGSILTAPGIITTAGGAAAGAAAGQALEEGIETALGIQKQSLPEVLTDVAQEAALAGVVDLVTLGTFRAGKAVIGGGARRLSASGEAADPTMGRSLLDRDYRPSLERVGAPALLAKGAKFVKGATGDTSDIINNTTRALEEKQDFLNLYKAVSAEEGGDAFISTTNKRIAELSAKESAASRSALKAVQDSIDFIGRSVDEGTDINNETLNAITSSFRNFQDVAVTEFRIMDDMISRLEASAIPDATSVGGKTRIVPVAGIKAAADDLIAKTGSKRVLPGPVQVAMQGIEDLGKSGGKASFEQIATQRKLINDALFEAKLGPEAIEQLFKLRDAFDNSLSADYLTANIKGLRAPQRKLLKQIENQRKKARETYSTGMSKFDDLRKFSIIRDIRQALNDGRFDSDNFFAKIVRRDQPERLKSVLNAVDDSELVRSQLAKSFVEDAMQRTSVDLLNPDQFNGALFRNRINNLGNSTGRVLFGSDWPQVQKLADTIAQVGTRNISQDAVNNIVRLDADRGIIQSMDDLIKTKDEIGRLNQINAVDKLNKGNLTPEEAVGELINYKTKPADWKKIEELFANDQGALQDVRRSMIEKILSAVDEDVFTSPKAAATLKTELGRYDQSVMKQVLGEPVYDNINKFADEMIFLGDVGKEGSIAQGAVAAQLSSNPIQAVKRDLRMRGMAKFFSNPALLNYYAGKGTPTAMSNVQGVFNGIGNVLESSAIAMTAGRQFGIRALNEQLNRKTGEIEAARNQRVEPVAPPSTASGIGQVDVFGSTLPIGARGSTNAGRGNLRQMATNNPAVAQALGIRGATAGLL